MIANFGQAHGAGRLGDRGLFEREPPEHDACLIGVAIPALTVPNVGVHPVVSGTVAMAGANQQIRRRPVGQHQLIPGEVAVGIDAGRVYFAGRQRIGVVARVEKDGIKNLALIADTGAAPGLLLGPTKSGQQHRCQDRDDRDDDQQLNQRKCPRRVCRSASWRDHRSADFQSAVSRVSNRPGVGKARSPKPTGSRRYSRLETCATLRQLPPHGGSIKMRPVCSHNSRCR